MTKPAVEIRGVNSVNYGALLMLAAAASRLEVAGISTAVDGRAIDVNDQPNMTKIPRLESRRLGGSNKWIDSVIAGFAPVLPRVSKLSDIVGLLDCSGFVFSDQVPEYSAARAVAVAEDYVARGLPVIAMPQSYGPFRNARSRELIRRFASCTTVIYVRDSTSMRYLLEAGVDKAVLKSSPDMTVGLVPTVSSTADDLCIVVPSQRLVDRPGGLGQSYFGFIGDVLSRLRLLGYRVELLCHERHDAALVSEISCSFDVDVAVAPDPLEAKRRLGSSALVVASRFHAAVSALSMAVPTMTIGWSHKYEDLRNDFGEGCAKLDRIEELDAFVSAAPLARSSLPERAESLRAEIDIVWRQVLTQLNREGKA